MNFGETRSHPVIAVSLAALLAAAGCAPSGDGAADGSSENVFDGSYEAGMIGADGGGDPEQGGTFTLGAYSEPGVLDPAETIVSGSTGGVEMAAVYDVLMRWNDETDEVEPQLAASLESSEDDRTWTLELREDVTFSDGTPLDAEAVRWSIERYVDKDADEAVLWENNVAQVRTPNETTVVFELNTEWPGFEHLLTTGPGMIVAPSAEKGGEFTPVGAGPFELVEHAEQEELVLRANEDYWDGQPYLDEVRVVFLNDPRTALESFETGSIDAAFLRDAEVVDEALSDGHAGYLNMVALGKAAVINASEGRPGADPRVRQAMHHAINPERVMDRAHEGAGVASNEVFPEFSGWHSDQDALQYDPERAEELLEQARSDGFDGSITYTDGQDPASRATALTVKSSLEAVGFEVELDLVRTIADRISQVAVDENYDAAGWGISWREAGPYARMFATMHSQGNFSVGMHTSDEMDELLEEFQRTDSEDEQREIMGRIQQQWNADVPALIYGPTPEFLTWSDAVHGIEGAANSMILLDQAWVEHGE